MRPTMQNILILICMCVIFAVVHGNAKSMRLKRSHQGCGVRKRSSGLIVNGRHFSRGSFPWIVALMYTVTEPPSYFCGGTLISTTYVVSAAHCIRPKESRRETLPEDVLALFGAHNLSNCFETGRYALSPKRILKHEEWNPWTAEYDADVSLLEFERESIHFNTFVQPICLLGLKVEPTATRGSVTGWGMTEDSSKLHEVVPKLIAVQIQGNEKCLPKHGKLAEISSERTFCAGLRNGSGVCLGDSGSGLFIEVDDIYHLKGIVSSSLLREQGCDVSSNAVYTNVPKFRDWIENITGAARNLFCTFVMTNSFCCGQLSTCVTNRTIDTETFVLASAPNTSVEQFLTSKNKDVKFLPRNIGELFPNLKEFQAKNCGLKIVRDYYFIGMRNLQLLSLTDNQISNIEPNSFKQLVSVKTLNLNDNVLETLDDKLFASMVNLEALFLNDNTIKFLSATTFKILDGKLKSVGLLSNFCIDRGYGSRDLDHLETDIRSNCTR